MKILFIKLLKSLQKHCQMVFSRFSVTTISVPAENTLNFLGSSLNYLEQKLNSSSRESGVLNGPSLSIISITGTLAFYCSREGAHSARGKNLFPTDRLPVGYNRLTYHDHPLTKIGG
jgi:hypothetical protein